MSKSKGNVIDPLTMIDKYGTDAFRFTLAAFAVMGRDVKMSEHRVEGYRNFVNKLWNAARFSLMHITAPGEAVVRDGLDLPDRWILSRLDRTIQTVEAALTEYKYNEAAGSLYSFIWHEFCDWYLEAIKPVLYDDGSSRRQMTLNVLYRVIKDTLLLLHPFMPFVTEEIWNKLPGTVGSIMKATFPEADTDGVMTDPEAEAEMTLVMDVITGVRNIRGEMNLAPSLVVETMVQSPEAGCRETLTRHADLIRNLAKISVFEVTSPGEKPKTTAAAVIQGATVLVNLKGLIDFEKETVRLEKEIGKVTKELVGMSRKLANEGFLEKAPADVVQGVRDKHNDMTEKLEKLQASLERIQRIA